MIICAVFQGVVVTYTFFCSTVFGYLPQKFSSHVTDFNSRVGHIISVRTFIDAVSYQCLVKVKQTVHKDT